MSRYNNLTPTAVKNTNLDKLNKLSDKLNVINVNIILKLKSTIDEEKGSKFEFLHDKISEVEDRMNEINDQNQKKFSIVRENVN
jgi:hypothetical protein